MGIFFVPVPFHFFLEQFHHGIWNSSGTKIISGPKIGTDWNKLFQTDPKNGTTWNKNNFWSKNWNKLEQTVPKNGTTWNKKKTSVPNLDQLGTEIYLWSKLFRFLEQDIIFVPSCSIFWTRILFLFQSCSRFGTEKKFVPKLFQIWNKKSFWSTVVPNLEQIIKFSFHNE